MRNLARLLVVTSALVGSTAGAQICNGFTSFAAAPLRLDVGANFGDGATQFGAGVNFGRAQGAFGGVNAGFTTYDGDGDNSTEIGANIGYQIPVGTTRRAQLCPLAQGTASFIEGANGQQLQLGGRLGGQVTMTPTTMLVPYAGLDLAYSRISIDDFDESFTDTYGILSLGAGLVLNQRFTIRPQVEIPLGLDDADARFGITVGIGFPRR